MKYLIHSILFVLTVAVSGCHEGTAARSKRLKTEIMKLQESSLRALINYQLTFGRDFGEKKAFFDSLRADLERCRRIEAQLKKLAKDPEVAKLEETTSLLFLAIDKDEEEMKRFWERTEEHLKKIELTAPPAVPSPADIEKLVKDLERTVELYKKHGHDSKHIEKLIEQLRNQPDQARIQERLPVPESAGAGQVEEETPHQALPRP